MNDKYLLIAAEEGNHSIALMCRLLRVDRTGYHRWHADRGAGIDPGSRRARRTRLGAVIMGMWLASRKAHGVRRIHADLAAVGEPASRWLVWKIMCELGIAGVQPRARKRTTIPADDAGVPAKWRGIGIRIEDDVLVTADGHRVLTGALERSADEVEQLMAG